MPAPFLSRLASTPPLASRHPVLAVGLLVALLALLGSSAGAAPVTYDLTSGQITTIQFLDPTGAAVPCPIGGSGNCLVNAPVAIDSGTIVLDQGALVLASLSFHSSGPSLINFGGAIGLQSMSVANATFQTSGSSPLTAGSTAGAFNFGPAAGTLTSDLTVTPTVGSPTLFPGYSMASNPAGSIFVNNTTAHLNLVGVDLGTVCNPLAPTQCLVVKADFGLTATSPIPEPQAFLVFAAGLLLVAQLRSGPRAARART